MNTSNSNLSEQKAPVETKLSEVAELAAYAENFQPVKGRPPLARYIVTPVLILLLVGLFAGAFVIAASGDGMLPFEFGELTGLFPDLGGLMPDFTALFD